MAAHRSVEKVLAVLVVTTVLAGGCSGEADSTTPSSDTTREPTSVTTAPPPPPSTGADLKPYGGTVVVAALEPEDNNYLGSCGGRAPHTTVIRLYPAILANPEAIDGESATHVRWVLDELPTVENGLVRLNGDGTMTVRYEIDDDARWGDATPITGEDFAFTIDQILDLCPDPPLDWGLILRDSYVIEPKSFTVTFSQETFRGPAAPVIPHDLEGHFLHDWPHLKWATGGPFVVDEWLDGDSIRLARNANYWQADPDTGQQLPYLDEVIFRFYDTLPEMIGAFEAREVDIVAGPMLEMATLSDHTDPAVSVSQQRAWIWDTIGFNFAEGRLQANPDSLIHHVEFRQAIAHAIDREAIAADLAGDENLALDSYLSVFSVERPGPAPYSYSPDTARVLIEDLCGQLGRDCDVDPPSISYLVLPGGPHRQPLADTIVAMLEDVGVEVEVAVDDPTWEMLRSGRWEMTSWGTPGDLGIEGAADWTRQHALPNLLPDDPTRRLIEIIDAMTIGDLNELRELVFEAEQIVSDQVYFLPLFVRANAGAVWADEVAGYDFGITWGEIDTWNIARWYRVDQ